MQKRYCVVYRTGGTLNFRWHRTVAFTKDAALIKRAEVERMGYKALLEDYDLSVAIGLPETYE